MIPVARRLAYDPLLSSLCSHRDLKWPPRDLSSISTGRDTTSAIGCLEALSLSCFRLFVMQSNQMKISKALTQTHFIS